MGYVHCRRQCVEARSADLYIARSGEIFFTVIFQLPGWGLVAPSCFALHCHCSLVSVQSVTVSLSTWKGNVRCAGSPRLLATSFSKSHVVVSTCTCSQSSHRTQQRPVCVQTLKFCCNATGLVNLALEPGPQYVAMYPRRRTLSAA